MDYVVNRIRTILGNLSASKQAMWWSNEETFYIHYAPGDILVYWGLSNSMKNLTEIYPNNSYVFAPGDYYYLDCGLSNPYGGKDWCDPYKTWVRIYTFEPSTYLNDSRVLGGEVCAWGEMFNNENLESRIWPRAASLADKLWGPLEPIDLVALSKRLTAFSETLNYRGIRTSPITGKWCE